MSAPRRPDRPVQVTRAPRQPQRRPVATEPTPAPRPARRSAPALAQRRDERERERRSARRRRLAIVWGRRAGYLLVAVALVWLVLLSPVFALDPAKVTVSGYGTVVDPTAVRGVIAGDEGTSLALLSVGHVASALKDVPGVREAHVQRAWPDGLTITLESREPVAALPDGANGFVYVDDEGVHVGRTAQAPTDLPTFSAVGDQNALTAALDVIAALPADLRTRIDTMSAATEDSVTFTLADGPTVEWGSAEDSGVKAQVLGVLLQSDQASKADVIDVSAPTLPITKNN